MDRLPDTDKLSHHISDMLRNDKAPIGIISSNFFFEKSNFPVEIITCKYDV